MREAFVIAKREFIERVRTKWFVVMTILGPLLMVGMIVIPALLAGRGYSGAKVAIVDHTGKLGPALAEKLGAPPLEWHVEIANADGPQDELRKRIRDHTLNGYLVVPKGVLDIPRPPVGDDGEVVYYGENASNQAVKVLLQRLVPGVIAAARAEAAHLTADQRDAMLVEFEVKTRHDTGKGETVSGMATFFLGYMIALILYMVITLYGVSVMRSVVTEKSSRVVELMVAATNPRAMMTGKILGVGGAGLAQIALWLLVGGVALAYQSELLGTFGVKGGAGLPALTAIQLAVIAAFFVLGYLFYSTMFAAVGATVSSEQESQQAQTPIMMLLVIGMVSMTAVTGDPRGSTTALMTQVPFWSPMLMPLRYLLGGASLSDVALSLGILLVSIVVIARAAAKIYRVGILMYGKRPGLGELIRWLRY